MEKYVKIAATIPFRVNKEHARSLLRWMFREEFFAHDSHIENDLFQLDDGIFFETVNRHFSRIETCTFLPLKPCSSERCSSALGKVIIDLRLQRKRTFCSLK